MNLKFKDKSMARALLGKQQIFLSDIQNKLWKRQRIIDSIGDHSASLLYFTISLDKEY